jgi:hypothetical protein
MPMYADFIYIGLSAVFCAPADADLDARPATSAAGCEEVRLHVLERSPKRALSNFSAGERVRVAIGLTVNYDYDVPPWVSVFHMHAHLCVVMPTDRHHHHHAALRAVTRSLRCGDEIFDPARPWSSSFLMPFRDYRTRPDYGFRGNFSLSISFQAQEGSAQLPLLAATVSNRILTCSITQTPNICDHESANVAHLSSPLLPAVQHSHLWRLQPPTSCAPLPSPASPSCFVAVAWTFWSDPPPYEIDWLSEVIDASGCEVSHMLDLQMLCNRRLFSHSPAAAKFDPAYAAPSKVFVVSYFSKDFERGFGLTESCILSWYLDGFDPVLVHFGDDSNSYDYLRYPRLHFVIRNHPANVSYGDDTFRNILHLGIGYKVGFWPSTLRNISLRRDQPVFFWMRAVASRTPESTRAASQRVAGTPLSEIPRSRFANFLSRLPASLPPNLKIALNGCVWHAAAGTAATDPPCSKKHRNSTTLPAWALTSELGYLNLNPNRRLSADLRPLFQLKCAW